MRIVNECPLNPKPKNSNVLIIFVQVVSTARPQARSWPSTSGWLQTEQRSPKRSCKVETRDTLLPLSLRASGQSHQKERDTEAPRRSGCGEKKRSLTSPPIPLLNPFYQLHARRRCQYAVTAARLADGRAAARSLDEPGRGCRAAWPLGHR